jgi:alpha-L-fucosidase
MKTRLTPLLVAVACTAAAEDLPKVPGPFDSSQDSLTQYECPDWFRDAKFGIWSHWGPQSVPMAGDWYAKHLYTENNHRGDYEHHLKNYGHPSEKGWKDILPLWKAEKFDPESLMKLYKAAGAKYFVSMAVHHDNFDLWDSKTHKWNAVKMGPKRDIVGDWQKAAKAEGLPFGVSEHLAASFWWWQDNKGADTKGEFAGVPYDGNDPAYEDLYHWKADPADDSRWYTSDKRWHQIWFNRISDLVSTYKPDLLYSDGGLPFGETGRTLVSNYYNQNIADNGGKLEAVYNCKQRDNQSNAEFIPGSYTQDMERGLLPGINPLPWQTDTSIGDWFYNKDYKNKDTGTMYRSPEWVIRTLVDIVSKNGNLLLNVIQKPDGSIDPEVETLLADVGTWMKMNGDAIYGTRPWTKFGEGPSIKSMNGGDFKEDFKFTAKDIRFTTKGDKLYAITMGIPTEDKLTIESLGLNRGTIKEVKLLGHPGDLEWTQSQFALDVKIPSNFKGKIALALEVTGSGFIARK